MDNDNNRMQPFGGSGNPRLWSGLILLACGGLLLAYKMGAPIPDWIFTWPVILILVGVLTAVKSGFRNPGGLVLIAIGTIFLIDQSDPRINFHEYIVPAILISVGVIFITRPHSGWSRHERGWKRGFYQGPGYDARTPLYSAPPPEPGSSTVGQEWVEINAAFGSVKKIILSKNFRGGEINCFMGGAELNMMQADMLQPARLEINNVFGGTKIIVPSNWDIKNEMTAVFGGIEDKRTVAPVVTDAGKSLVLHGTCVFGGIEVINY